MVKVERIPRTDLYRLNTRHELVEPLRKLFELEPKLKLELMSVVAREVRSRRLPVKEARLFGSAARGTMAPESDLDLALVTSPDKVEAVEEAAQAIAEVVRDRFGARLHVLVGSPSLASLARSRDGKRAVWQAIEREGIDVFSGAGVVA